MKEGKLCKQRAKVKRSQINKLVQADDKNAIMFGGLFSGFTGSLSINSKQASYVKEMLNLSDFKASLLPQNKVEELNFLGYE